MGNVWCVLGIFHVVQDCLSLSKIITSTKFGGLGRSSQCASDRPLMLLVHSLTGLNILLVLTEHLANDSFSIYSTHNPTFQVLQVKD
jgi:hypothetical protein